MNKCFTDIFIWPPLSCNVSLRLRFSTAGWFRALRRGLGSLSEPKGESLCLDRRGVNRTSALASIRKRSFPKVPVKEAVFRFPEQPGLFTLHAPEQA